MPLPLIGPVVSSIAGYTLAAGFAASIVAGILRVITLLGVGVAVFEGTDTLLPYLDQMMSSAANPLGTGASNPAFAALGQVMALLKVQAAFSLVIGAVATRIAFRASLILTRTATGGT